MSDTIIYSNSNTPDNICDTVADKFEHDWTKKSIDALPSILNEVTNISDHLKTELAAELFQMDIELRFKYGYRVSINKYVQKFPQFETEIKQVYDNVISSRTLGKYEYYENIGKGGMSSVYRGQHQLIRRDVAVKLLHTEIIERVGKERFLREVRIGGSLTNEHFVKTEYAGNDQGKWYLVMEFIRGKTLRQIVKENEKLSQQTVCEIICQVAEGLQFASDNGIIHRDIKPENLMITQNGVVKILDLGLGKFTTANQTEQNLAETIISSTMGSVDYIAPEQWKDASSVSIQADIYSLGCVFFFLLTGHAPFENPQWNRDQRMAAHFQDTVPPLSNLYNKISPEIEQCYKKMMAKNPKERFRQPAELIPILKPFTDQNVSLASLAGSEGTDSSVILPSRFFMQNKQQNPKRRSVFIRYLTHTAVAMIAATGVYYLGTLRQKSPTIPATPSGQDQETNSLLPPKTVNVDLAQKLQYVPFNGCWWFLKIPYYLPVIRENNNWQYPFVFGKFPESLSIRNGVLSLNGLEHPLFDFLAATGFPNAKQLPKFESLVYDYIGKTENNKELSATVLHTQAVLLHALMIAKNSPETGHLARDTYIVAIQQYENEKTDSALLLQKLCRFDLAYLNWWLDENPEKFENETSVISTDEFDSPLFRCELKLAAAERLAAIGQRQNETFDAVYLFLEQNQQPELLKKQFYNRYANILTLQRLLTEAQPLWETVWKLAVQEAEQMLPNKHKHLARLCEDAVNTNIVQIRIQRYFCNLDKARYDCRELLGNMNDVIAYLDTFKPDYAEIKHRLIQQRLCVTELLADCLFDSIQQTLPEKEKQNVDYFLSEAGRLYSQIVETATDHHQCFIVRCKLALLQFLSGHTADQKEWDKIQTAYSRLDNTENTMVNDFYNATETFLATNPTTEKIVQWLEQYRMNMNVTNRYADEKLDLQLYGIRYLALLRAKNNEMLSDREIERYLLPLLTYLEPEPAMRPFLLQFYDIAVQGLKQNDLFQTALLILASRCRTLSEKKAVLLFYFPLQDKNGFAVFLPQDRQNIRCFELPFNRLEVQCAASEKRSLVLPEELISLVKKSPLLDVSWDDQNCWAESKRSEALTKDHWVFNLQLVQGVVR
jgi:serine/threonine protein kinase